MFHNFIEVDLKLILTWMGTGSMVMLNKFFGFNIQNYEFWTVFIIDSLTVLSLVVALGYTIARWRKLNKK